MNDDADANVWSSGIQRLSGVDVDRLNAVLCCCLTTTVGTNASMTLIARATAAQMVDIIGALILDSILNSRQLHPTLLPGCFSSMATPCQGSWLFMFMVVVVGRRALSASVFPPYLA